MKTAAFIIGLLFIYSHFTEITPAEGFTDPVVQSECRDRYFWIHVASGQTPRFEAVDEHGVHSISEQLASRCGYTMSTFKMDGFTTFRASYYSCFTHNQNDEVFTFRFNVMLSDAGGGWISQPVSAVCSGLMWTHREIICEEDYMEVNVNRESSCGGQRWGSGHVWQAAYSQAHRTATPVWQLMILQNDGQVSSMSISEAQRQGYSLTTTAQRVVLRSRYKQPHAELTMVDSVPVEVIQASLFLKQKLTVVMIDMTMACTVNLGSFDGTRLLWDIPRVVTPLVGEGAGFESRSLSLGVDGVLLDKPTTAARGFSLVQQGYLIQIGVPFGAEGGYKKSLVVNNVYKETYVIFLLYEHVFSLLYEDGSSIDTRHRMLRVLDTPLLCRPPFSLDQTMSDDQVFSVYLGNIPADVLLEDVQINKRQLMMSESTERGYSITPVVHVNGSRAYELRLPFEHEIVHWMYLGEGVVQYSIDINFTLTIMPQRNSYYHHTFITARVFNTFPPEITAQCSDRGITFTVVRLPRAQILWEVGVDHEPLTSLLATQRGYRFHNNTHRTSLEVPVYSIGYTYEDINLSNFYGTFKLFLRDSKTLEVQTSTSKRCLFKTQDMIVCSADGTMTVVTTPTSTWPTVQPKRTTLLDPTCGPKQTDGSRVLFEFQLNSCGTRAMVGESYVVYENEILHDRQMIADGPNFISRDSQFKLTVRCFYPLGGVNRVSVDRIFTSGTAGFGSVQVFQSVKADSSNKLPAQDCSHHVSGDAVDIPTNHVHQTPAAEGVLLQLKPGSSHFITVPAGHNKLLSSSQTLQTTVPNLNLSPPPEGPTFGIQQVPLQVSSHPGPLMSQTQDQQVFKYPSGAHLPTFLQSYDYLTDQSAQLSHLSTLNFNPAEVRGEDFGLTEDKPASESSYSNRSPDSPAVGQLLTDSGSSSQTLTLQDPKGLGDHVWYSGLNWDQPSPGQNGITKTNQDLQSLTVDGANLDMSLYEPSGSGMEMTKTVETPGPQSQNVSPQTSYLHLSVDTQGSVTTQPTSTATTQVNQNLDRPGSIDRRNTETVQSRVQNIRVKPLRKFVSSGHPLNQKPSQSFNPSQYGTGLTAVSGGGNRRTSQQLPEHRGLNTRPEPVRETTSFSTLKLEQGVHNVRVKPDRTSVIRLTGMSPNQQKLVHPPRDQQGQQQKLVHPPRDQQGQQQKLVHPPRDQQGQQQKLVHPPRDQQRQQQKLVHPPRDQQGQQQKLVHAPRDQQGQQQKLVHAPRDQQGQQQKLVHATRDQQGQQQKLVHATRDQQGQQQKLVHATRDQQGQQQKLVHAPRDQQRQQQKLVHAPRDQQGQQQKLVQSVAESGDSQGLEFVSTVLQPSGPSHIRVRLVPGLSGGLQTHYGSKVENLQNPSSQSDTKRGPNRTSSLILTPQNVPNTPVNIREHQPSDQTAGGAGFTGFHTGPNGSNGSGSDPNIHITSDCSGRYGDSVHQGIMRGTHNTP